MYVILEGKCGFYTTKLVKTEMSILEFLNNLYKLANDNIEESDNLLQKLELENKEVLNPYEALKTNKYNIANYNKTIKDYNVIVTIQETVKAFEKTAGESFGECTSFKKTRRLHNVVTDTDCNLLSLDLVDYREIMNDLLEKKYSPQISEIKSKHSIFKTWPMKYMVMLIPNLKKEIIKKNDLIIKQNSNTDYIYLILKGELQESITINTKNFKKYFKYIKREDTSITKLIKERKEIKQPELDEVLLSYSKLINIILKNNNFFLFINIKIYIIYY